MKYIAKSPLLLKFIRHEKGRFVLVGALNTLVDFTILFLLVNLFGTQIVIANVISTTCALLVSYLLNKNAVFKNTDTHNYRQILLFAIVTLSGLWLLQGVVVIVTEAWLSTYVYENIALFIAKSFASLFSLIWNYLWYSRVVFHKQNTSKK